MRSLLRRHAPLLRFWLVFFTGLIAVHTLVVWGGEDFVDVTTHANARMSAWLLDLLGAEGRAEGRIVHSTLLSVEIIFECTAVYPIGMFVAAVLAYPASWRARLAGIGLGVPILVLVNLARIVSLCWIGRWHPTAFETAHLVVWQSLIIFVTFVLWMAWSLLLASRGRAHA